MTKRNDWRWLLILPVLLCGVAIAASNNVSFLVKTVAATNTPEVLGTTATKGRTVIFTGNKAARTANTGTVWIQTSSADGAAGLKLTTGATVTLTASDGKVLEAADFWIDVETAGDGVVALFVQ